jgi:hypothetical protein
MQFTETLERVFFKQLFNAPFLEVVTTPTPNLKLEKMLLAPTHF